MVDIDVYKLLNDAGYEVRVYAFISGRTLKAFSRVDPREFRMHGLYKGLARATLSLLNRCG